MTYNMNYHNSYLQSALKLGLSGKASAVYVFLLKAKKPVAPVKIINATSLHRQYAYDALHELLEKDLIETVGLGRGTKYFAHTPNKALKEFEEKRLDAMEGISHLMSLYKTTPHGVVEIIEGAEAVIESEMKIMREQKKNSYLDIIGGAGTGFLNLFKDRFEEYEKIRKEVQCNIRCIVTESDVSYKDDTRVKSRFNYEERYLEKIDDVVNICVRPDTASFNIFSPEPIVIRLNNPQTIISQKALFEILWGIAK